LTVSKGPEPFSMPDVRGRKCSDAKKQLEALGLKVVVKSSAGKQTGCSADRIAAQDPVPDATVRKGDEATLYILT
ncbi:MAG TPA: PASTA domain-containing protein, partial [Actinomycetota bacterium]|nr:PASTA domain-containing protein [Actinomycetota bacterium]